MTEKKQENLEDIQLLSKIQAELNVPKKQRNNFGNYNYRSLEDIFEALKPLIKKYGISVTVNDEILLIGERYYVKATAILFNKNGNKLFENTAYAREPENKKGMDEAQITGATSSYARKYAMNGLFCLDDNKDADTDEHKIQQEKTSNTKPPQGKQTFEQYKKHIEAINGQMGLNAFQQNFKGLITKISEGSTEQQKELYALYLDKCNEFAESNKKVEIDDEIPF